MAAPHLRSPFVLAHHHPEDYGRCYEILGFRVCARCLGLYPVLAAGLAFELWLRGPAQIAGDAVVVVALSLPAVVDWARGRFDPATGTNAVRTVTGALIGIALARSLYLNMREPANGLSVAHFAGLFVVAAVVEVASRPHRLRRRLSSPGQPGG